jgi:predicted dehydrogenase
MRRFSLAKNLWEVGFMNSKSKIRYAVVGLGHIAQVAVLPGFKKATTNSELTALISGDGEKLRELSKLYDVPKCYAYDEFEKCMRSGDVDAVYISTPNSLHRRYVDIAARHGVHVLTEKPMAITEDDCEDMIRVCEQNKVKLMVAYRLHFDPANLRAIEMAKTGSLGDPRIFNSVFTMQVKDPQNIRLQGDMGGGTLFDIGIYCINAARYLFRDEPTEVFAFSANNGEARFSEIDEMTTAIMRFPGDRLATFTSSFGAEAAGSYELIGTRGRLRLENAYDYAEEMDLVVYQQGRIRRKKFAKHDQFAPQIEYFSDCILQDQSPEPSGREGLADIRVIRALLESAQNGRPVRLDFFEKHDRPSLRQEFNKVATPAPPVIHAEGPQGSPHHH